MSIPWMKVWTEKILSSINLQECSFTEHALFLELLIRVRTEEKYVGKIVYPETGIPIPDDVLWRQIKLKPSLYRKAKKALVERGIIKLDTNRAIIVRKFGILQAQFKNIMGTSREQVGNNSGTTNDISPYKSKGLSQEVSPYKDKDKDKDKEIDICLSLFAYWNSLPNVLTHRMLTDRIRRAISGRLGEGYTAGELRTMMSNYSEILTGGLLKQYFWTYRWGLTDFLARHKDRFNDIVIARQTFANREQYQDNRVQCSECSGKGKYTLQGTEQRCHKCGGRGYVPDVSKMPKEK